MGRKSPKGGSRARKLQRRASVHRKRVHDLEIENSSLKTRIKELDPYRIRDTRQELEKIYKGTIDKLQEEIRDLKIELKERCIITQHGAKVPIDSYRYTINVLESKLKYTYSHNDDLTRINNELYKEIDSLHNTIKGMSKIIENAIIMDDTEESNNKPRYIKLED